MSTYSRILMLGTALDTRGGISSVVNTYIAHGLMHRWPVRYIPTHRDANGPVKLLTMLQALARTAVALVRERRTVVHVHVAPRASFWRKAVFVGLAFAARCPVILHLHSGFTRFYEHDCGAPAQALARWMLARATRIIVPTERKRRWVASVAPAAKVVRIAHPVTDVTLMPLPGRRTMIIYVGRLERRTGLYDLIEAVSALRLRIPEVTLVCAGEGDRAAAAEFAERVGVADAVTFTGWVTPAELRTLLQRAAAFVMTSYVDVMPVSLLEAMVARVPLIATAVDDVTEIIDDGVNGFLFRPGDVPALHRVLSRLLHDGALAARVATAARRNVAERFAAETILSQLGALYTELDIARGAPRSASLEVRTPQEVA